MKKRSGDGENDLKKKRGRPKKGGAKSIGLHVRLTEDESERLEKLSQRSGESKADIIRKAFNSYEILRNIQLDSDEEDLF